MKNLFLGWLICFSTLVFAQSDADTVVIELNSNDKMQFDKKEIVVKEGQVVQLHFHHTGTIPKTAMGHNWVLIDNAISIEGYAAKTVDSEATDMFLKMNLH